MKKSKVSDEVENKIDTEQNNPIEDVIDITSNNENENKRDDKNKKDLDPSFKELKEDHETNKLLKNEDLETQASKKCFLPGYSKTSHHRGRFTSTWVQYADSNDLGYAYGGVDPLNYEPTTKNRFVRRVFTIVLIFLIVTSLFNFYSAKLALRSFFEDTKCLFFIIPIAIILLSMNCFAACSECARSPPFNFVCLFLSLIGVTIVTGFISGYFNTLLILYACVTTAFVSLAFVIIANTSYNFTHWTLYLIGICVALPIISVCIAIAYFRIIEHVRPAYQQHVLILAFTGTLIQVVIITAMLQIILGSQAVEILEDDYSLGAFYLYTSIYDIFIKIVQMIIVWIFGHDDE